MTRLLLIQHGDALLQSPARCQRSALWLVWPLPRDFLRITVSSQGHADAAPHHIRRCICLQATLRQALEICTNAATTHSASAWKPIKILESHCPLSSMVAEDVHETLALQAGKGDDPWCLETRLALLRSQLQGLHPPVIPWQEHTQACSTHTALMMLKEVSGGTDDMLECVRG